MKKAHEDVWEKRRIEALKQASKNNVQIKIMIGKRNVGYIHYDPKYNWWGSWHNQLDFGHDGMSKMEDAFLDVIEMDARRDIPFWD